LFPAVALGEKRVQMRELLLEHQKSTRNIADRAAERHAHPQVIALVPGERGIGFSVERE